MIHALVVVLLGFIIAAALLHSGVAAFPLLLLIPVAIAAAYALRHTWRRNTPS